MFGLVSNESHFHDPTKPVLLTSEYLYLTFCSRPIAAHASRIFILNQRTQSRIFVRSSSGNSTSAITELPSALYNSISQFVSIVIPSKNRTTKK